MTPPDPPAALPAGVLPAGPADRVTVVTGPGGGGPLLARALIRAAEGASAAISEDAGMYRGGWLKVVDLAHCSGIGPAPAVAPAVQESAHVLVVRDRDPLLARRRTVDLTSPEGPGEAVALHLLGSWGDAASRQRVAARLRGASAVLGDLLELGDEGDADGLVRATPTYQRLLSDVIARGGHALLDVARPLVLAHPYPVDCGDEWARLASALSGRTYAVSDLAICLYEFVGLFAVVDEGLARVRPASPLARELLHGGIATSTSEHGLMYRALRDLAVDRVSGTDESDPFIAEQLPMQAEKGDVLDLLATDARALLACDPMTLVSLVEAEAGRMLMPGFKAYLLSTHRMFESTHRSSQLELAARRSGLDELAASTAARRERRLWSAIWARSQAVNVHRVLLNRRSPNLSVCAAPDGSTAWAGFSDGTLWRIAPYRPATLLWQKHGAGGEIRAVAAGRDAQGAFIVAGASDQSVTVVDASTGQATWSDHDSHEGPLSTVTVGHFDDGVLLASAGVGASVFLHRRQGQGWSAEHVYKHASEIRGLVFCEVAGRRLLFFCAVDGVIGVVDVSSGELLARTFVKAVVFNGMSALASGGKVDLVAAASDGQIYRMAFDPAQPEPQRFTTPPDGEAVVAHHGADANTVSLLRHEGGLIAYSGASDGTLRITDLDARHSTLVVGHAGPIWSLCTLRSGGRQFVVTAGGEGSCRIWRPEAVLAEEIALEQANRHRGGAASVAVFGSARENLTAITGGEDGHVRHWPVNDPNGGALIVRHGGAVTAMAYLPGETHGRLVSGALDGTLRITRLDGSGESRLLGVAHDGVSSLAVAAVRGRTVLASGGLDGTVILWDVANLATLHAQSACHFGSVSGLCFLGEQSDYGLVVAGQDGSVAVFDQNLVRQRGITMPTGVLSVCAATGTETEVVAGLADGSVVLIREVGSSLDDVSFLRPHDAEVRSVITFDLAGRRVIASTGLDRKVVLTDLTTRTQLASIQLDGQAYSLAACTPWVAVGSSAGAAIVEFVDNPVVLISGSRRTPHAVR